MISSSLSGYARLSELSGELKKIDYAFADLDDDSVSNFETVRRVVGDISKEYAEGHSCIVFFSQKKHLEMYRKQLINHIPESRIGTYYGDNKEDVNNEVLSLAERGKIKVTLSTYSKSREGTNCKSWEVAFLVSSIADGKNVEQAIGRIRRTKEGKISTVRVYDYRYDNVAVLCNQGSKRDARYNKLHFNVKGDSDKGRDIFRRGYKKF
jgi:superfamily II DNA or RNA helicase